MDAIVRYDHDDATDTEISVEIAGVKTRFDYISDAAAFLGIDDLLERLERDGGETTVHVNRN